MTPEILKFSRWLHLRDEVQKAEAALANLKERFERATDDLALVMAPLDDDEARQKTLLERMTAKVNAAVETQS